MDSTLRHAHQPVCTIHLCTGGTDHALSTKAVYAAIPFRFHKLQFIWFRYSPKKQRHGDRKNSGSSNVSG